MDLPLSTVNINILLFQRWDRLKFEVDPRAERVKHVKVTDETL